MLVEWAIARTAAVTHDLYVIEPVQTARYGTRWGI